MKFQVDRDVLSEAVSWTARSLAPRPPLPILSGVLIEAKENKISLSAFDYETSASISIEADVEEAGSALVSGRLLTDIARKLPAAPVVFESENNKVNLSCGVSSFTLASMPVDEYPNLPEFPESSGQIRSEEFSQAVSQVAIAASKEDSLPILTGVYIEFKGDEITLLATDRYRLAMRIAHWNPEDPNFEATVLIKSKTLNDVAKALATGGGIDMAIDTSGKANAIIGFEKDSHKTTSLLVDGEYPPVRSLFPEETPIYAVVNTQALSEAASRVSLVAEKNTPLRLEFSEGQVTLHAGTGEEAQASETLEAELNGEDITVAFNHQYLLEGLSAFDTPYVRLSFTTPMKPSVLTGQEELNGEDEQDYRYLVMPVRLPQ
ncbi:MAG: DNA polymerase III subunit beta [Micrococcaceae bacterium]